MTNPVLPLIKILIIPVMLLSILMRNRRDKRRRAEAEAAERRKREKAKTRRHVFDPATADPAALETALEQLDAGEVLVSPRGEDLGAATLYLALADALLAEDRVDDAEPPVRVVLAGDNHDARADALLRLARIHALRSKDEDARALLSEAADLMLAALRRRARGNPRDLAQLMAEGLPDTPPALSSADLADLGPLTCLQLSTRADEARALASDSAAVLERALADTADDPEGRVDGLPRALLETALARLRAV
jgi:hypothetical protein